MVAEGLDRIDGWASDDFDPFGPAFRSDPDALHLSLVGRSPGFITMEGVPSAYVASYADCAAALRDFKHWSSVKPKGLPGMERVDFFNGQPVMNYSDPPEHVRRRRVVNPAFTPKRVERLGEACELYVAQLLDEVEAQGRFDGVADLGRKMAVQMVLGEFMGLTPEDYKYFLNFVATLPLLDTLRPGDPKPQAYLDAWKAGREFCRTTIQRARDGQGSSILGVIAESADGGALSDDEMMAMMVVLMSGGFPTISGGASASLYNLVRTPGLLERLRAEPMLAGAVLEESIRLFPPVALVMRFAGQDTVLGGRECPPDMPLYVLISSACHDPEVFPDPFRFDPDRANAKDHLAFGFGMHTCIGNAITRLVVPILLRQVAERLPGLRLADPASPVVFDTTPRSRHVARLPLQV